MKFSEYLKWDTFRTQIKNNSFPMFGELKDENGNELEEQYKVSQSLLKKYFKALNTTDVDSIYHVVTLINAFYATRMGQDRCLSVAKHIVSQEKIFHKNIFGSQKERIDLIEKLTIKFPYIDNNGKSRYFRPYSFITKYCNNYTFAQDESKCLYPIYDSFIIDVFSNEFSYKSLDPNPYIKELKESMPFLLHGRQLSITQLKNPENFKNFYDCMEFLRDKYNTDFCKLNTFLWRRGKAIKDIKID